MAACVLVIESRSLVIHLRLGYLARLSRSAKMATACTSASSFPCSGPNAGQWATKTLPRDHKHLRVLSTVAAAGSNDRQEEVRGRATTATSTGGAGPSSTIQGLRVSTDDERDPSYNVGAWVEVYSNSTKTWCTGRVTKMTEDGAGVMVVFQLPGAGAEEYVEKWLPSRSELLREKDIGVATPHSPARPAIEWTPEETEHYKKNFLALCDLPDSSLKDADGSVVLKPDVTAEYLRRSGLPREFLKAIWHCATARYGDASTGTGFSEHVFCLCCRMVAHCQKVLRDGDAEDVEVLREELPHILAGQFSLQPCATLADFAQQQQSSQSETIKETKDSLAPERTEL